MRTTFLIVMIVIGVVLATSATVAHHAFSAEFDANKPVNLTGTVTRMDWINPHAWIYMTVTKPDGTEEEWMVEGGAPNALLRRGFNRDSLPPGTEIFIEGFQAKNGLLRANGRNITLPDGTILFVGSSGTGAPSDGRDPTER